MKIRYKTVLFQVTHCRWGGGVCQVPKLLSLTRRNVKAHSSIVSHSFFTILHPSLVLMFIYLLHPSSYPISTGGYFPGG